MKNKIENLFSKKTIDIFIYTLIALAFIIFGPIYLILKLFVFLLEDESDDYIGYQSTGNDKPLEMDMDVTRIGSAGFYMD
ncbi:MAG: hypothetical protein V3U87_14925 [Methylococcaceae bacterium]